MVREKRPTNDIPGTANAGAGAVRRPKAPHNFFSKIHVEAGGQSTKRRIGRCSLPDAQGNFLGSSALIVYGVFRPATLEAATYREVISLA